MIALMIRIMAAYVRIRVVSCAPDCVYVKFLLSLKKATTKAATTVRKARLVGHNTIGYQ